MLKNKKINLTVFFGLLLILIAVLHSNDWLNSDDGVILAGAWRIFQHQLIYRDFFEFVAPGTFYLIAGLWRLTGPTWLSAQIFSILIFWGALVGIYLLGKEFGVKKFALIAPLSLALLSYSWPLINHNAFNFFFTVWGYYFFLRWQTASRYWRLIAAGALWGTAILFLQTKGVIIFSGFLIILLLTEFGRKNQLKNCALYLLAGGMPLAVFFVWPLPLLWQNLVIFPLFNYGATNNLPLALFWTNCLFFVLLVGLLVRQKKLNRQLIGLIGLQILLFLGALSRPDFYHLGLAIFPLLIIWQLTLSSKTTDLVVRWQRFFTTVLVIIWLAAMLLTLFWPARFFQLNSHQDLLSYLKNNCPGQYLYVEPFMPGLYLEAAKINPTRFDWLITNQHTDQQFAQAAAALIATKPACAVINYSLVDKFLYNQNNPVDLLLKKDYSMAATFNQTQVLKLK